MSFRNKGRKIEIERESTRRLGARRAFLKNVGKKEQTHQRNHRSFIRPTSPMNEYSIALTIRVGAPRRDHRSDVCQQQRFMFANKPAANIVVYSAYGTTRAAVIQSPGHRTLASPRVSPPTRPTARPTRPSGAGWQPRRVCSRPASTTSTENTRQSPRVFPRALTIAIAMIATPLSSSLPSSSSSSFVPLVRLRVGVVVVVVVLPRRSFEAVGG